MNLKRIIAILILSLLLANILLFSEETSTYQRYFSPFSKNSAEWIYQRSTFCRDFNFTERKDSIVSSDNKSLSEWGIKKITIYTRPNDNNVTLVLLTDKDNLVLIAGVEFSKTLPDYAIYVKAFLADFGIEERTFGKNYPLSFIQGSVIQDISRSEKITMDAWGNCYLVDCLRGEKAFTVYISKDYSRKELTSDLIGAFQAK